MCHSIFVQRVIQSSKFFLKKYADPFSCLTIHFQRKRTYFFQILTFVYEKFQGLAVIKPFSFSLDFILKGKRAVGKRLREDNSHLSSWMKMALYQLSLGIIRKQMKEFERNKFLFSENGSLNTKNDQHIPSKKLWRLYHQFNKDTVTHLRW